MAVASSGMTPSAASAISRMPSARQAVCLASQNQVLRRPDLRVKSPVRIENSRRWSIRAARLSLMAATLATQVDDAGARYQLTDDPGGPAVVDQQRDHPVGLSVRYGQHHPDAHVEHP